MMKGYLILLMEGLTLPIVYEFEGNFAEFLVSVRDVVKENKTRVIIAPFFRVIYLDEKYSNALPEIVVELEEMLKKVGILDSRILAPPIKKTERIIEVFGWHNSTADEIIIGCCYEIVERRLRYGFSRFEKKGFELCFSKDRVCLIFYENEKEVGYEEMPTEEFIKKFGKAKSLKEFVEMIEVLRENVTQSSW